MEFVRSRIRRKAAISSLQIRGVFPRDSYSQTIFEIAWITSGRGVERHCMTRACESSRVSRRKWSIPANLENKISRKSKSLLKRHARKTYFDVFVYRLKRWRFCRRKLWLQHARLFHIANRIRMNFIILEFNFRAE